MVDELCTLAQVKAQNGIPDTTDDAVLTTFIDSVSAFIQGYTSRKFNPISSATYYFDTRAGYVLRVPIGIRAVTLLEVATSHQPDSGGTYTTVAASDYILRPRPYEGMDGWPYTEIQISRATLTGTITAFGTYQNGARVTMTAGFASVPLDIQSVCIDAVIAAYQARSDGTSSTLGADDISIAPWRDYFMRGSPQRAILDRYKYWAVT